jgi:hypothetical protein
MFSYRPIAFAFLGLLLWAATPAAAQDWPQKVTIMGEALVLKFRDSKPGFSLLEYIPAEETLDNWHTMFAVHLHDGRAQGRTFEARKFAAHFAQMINSRKPQDPIANAMAMQSPGADSHFVDFLVSQGNMAEHNVFRFSTRRR